ncbi:hypothetical protein [Streptomyces sp. NPDC049040]|uniref:hypothetical protein n=1 Tax=Streptomyces sp. NPDC049040 TaxID=3365593 RepID=UPI003723BBD5
MADNEQGGRRSSRTWLRRPAVRIAAVTLTLLAALPGCAHRTRTPGPQLPTASVPRTTAFGEAASLLTIDVAQRRQRWLLFRAEQILDEQCMRRKGYTYLVTELSHEPVAGAVTEDTPGSGTATYDVAALMPDIPTARTTGGRADEQSTVLPQDRYVSRLAPAVRSRYLAALDGNPQDSGSLTLPSGASGTYTRGGCVGEVRARIYHSVRAALQDELVPQDVTRTFHRFLTSDHSYQSALTTWQQCMARNGLRVLTPADAIRTIEALAEKEPDIASLDRRQHATAQQDRACDARSHLRERIGQARGVFLKEEPQAVLLALHQVYVSRAQALRSISSVV